MQVAPVGRQLTSAPLLVSDANPPIGPSTVSDPSFTSGDSRTPSEMEQGRFIFFAPDDASAVDYAKEDMDDDDDGVVNSHATLPVPITVASTNQIPVMTLDPEARDPGARDHDTLSQNRELDIGSHLARIMLNKPSPTTAARVTMSAGAHTCRSALKRCRSVAFGSRVGGRSSKCRRSEEIPSTLKDRGRDSSARPHSAL